MQNLSIIFFLVILTVVGDIIWVVTDPRTAQERRKRIISMTYPRVTFAIILQIISGLWFPYSLGRWNTGVSILGVLLFLFGMFFSLWARFVMGKRWAPPDNHDFNRQEQLITSGPFSLTRNPIYLGVILLTLGFAIAVRSYNIIFVIPLFMSLKKSAQNEEVVLERIFGQNYTIYKNKVRRFL